MEYLETDITTEETEIRGKQPWLGAFLGFFGFSCVGYFYAQRFLRGGIILFLETVGFCTFFTLMFFEEIPFVPFVTTSCVLLLTFKLYVTIDVFRSIKTQNLVDFENYRTQRKDPWGAVFWTFLWPGLGHVYLRRWKWFVIIVILNFIVFIPIEKVSDSRTIQIAVQILFNCVYSSIIALHCFYLCNKKMLRAWKIRHVYYAGGYQCLSQYISFLIVLVLVINFGQLYRIPSDSMSPTILAGDSVFVSKVSYRKKFPLPGDMVVFQRDGLPWPNVIKRVVALGGQIVEVNDEGVLFVDGEEFHCEGLIYKVDKKVLNILKNRKYLKNGKYQVPEGCYYVIGDNYSYSYDSRDFGPLNKDEIIGKAIRIMPKASSWWNTD